MKYYEYRRLQESFSKKLIEHPSNKEECYNNGVLACKSILKDIYENGYRKDRNRKAVKND